jgi:hypothetical protein
MPDYNLHGLSWRSFEQLVQALAVEILGPGVVAFGDGPDGGREAAFDGEVPYASDVERWRGYGVIQAKFHQRPQTADADGKWAVSQLQAELEKLAKRQTGRRPEYYLFATNVVLSPAQGGWKDRVYAVLDGYSGRLGLRGYAVWDYDQIRALLDASEDIRRAYAAFITPGDVLAQVVAGLKVERPGFGEVMALYLQKELLRDHFVNLEQAGHSTEVPTPLSRVFVDLPVADSPEEEPIAETEGDLRPGFMAYVVDAGNRKLDPRSSRMSTPTGGQPSATQRPGRFVLVGGPGQGKTTVGQHICQVYRAALLARRADVIYDPPVQDAIDLTDIPLPCAPRFPVRVELSKLADALVGPAPGRPESLLSYIVQHVRKRTDKAVNADDVRQWLRAYPWAIVLDGLDEVPASSNRKDVLAKIQEFWVEASECNADILVVATTRPQGYSDDFSPSIYKHLWLLPLSVARALFYAARLTEVRYGNDPERRQKIIDRLQRASSQPATARLMRSPLQVTIMATLVDQIGRPPSDRWRLFHEYYEVIYRREMERDIPAARILRDHRPIIDAMHSHVGFLLQVASEKPGQTDARLSPAHLGVAVQEYLSSKGYAGEELTDLRSRVIEASTERLVFLVGMEQDRIGFEIRSLQEFMAAECIMDGSDVEVQARLKELALHAHWRNVLLFVVGRCFAVRQYLADTVYSVSSELNDASRDPVAHATLAGSQLALEVLEDGSIRQHPKQARVFAELALRLVDLPPSPLHDRLAGVYEERFEDLYREAIAHRLAHMSTAERLGAWATLLPLVDRGTEWAVRIAGEHWPDAWDEQLEVAGALQGERPGLWLRSKIAIALPQAPLAAAFRALRDVDDEMNVVWPETEWGDVATKLLRSWRGGERTAVALNVGGTRASSLPLGFVAVDGASWLSPLGTMPAGAAEWRAMAALAEFSAQPEKGTLADALDAGVDAWGSWLRRFVIRRVAPWPIAECWQCSYSRDELAMWASAARGGRLGSTAEWRAAEDRWRRAGVSLQDADWRTSEPSPLSPSIASRGFPFFSSQPAPAVEALERAPSVRYLLHLLRLRHAVAGHEAMRQLVSSWIADRLWPHGPFSSLARAARVLYRSGQLRSILEDAAQEFNASLSLVAIALHVWGTSDEGIAIVDALGMAPYISTQGVEWIGAEAAAALCGAFAKDPARIGILRVLGAIAVYPGSLTLPLSSASLPDQLEPLGLEAAIVLRIASGGIPMEEAEQLAARYAQSVHEGHWSGSVTFAARTQRADDPGIDRFLVALWNLLSADDALASAVIDALDSRLRQRVSGLADAGLRRALSLPAVL